MPITVTYPGLPAQEFEVSQWQEAEHLLDALERLHGGTGEIYHDCTECGGAHDFDTAFCEHCGGELCEVEATDVHRSLEDEVGLYDHDRVCWVCAEQVESDARDYQDDMRRLA